MAKGDRLSPLFTWRAMLVKHGDVPAGVQHIGLVLSLYMSERGDSAWPSIRQLAADARRSESTVSTAIKSLEDAGWLEVGRSDGGRNKRNEYRGIVPPLVLDEEMGWKPPLGPNVSEGAAEAETPPGTEQKPPLGPNRKDHAKDHASTESPSVSPAGDKPVGTSREHLNAMWDAFTIGGFPDPKTKSERSRRGRAVRELVAIGASPEGVAARSKLALKAFGDGSKLVTEMAVVAHYTALGTNGDTDKEARLARLRQLAEEEGLE